jgi:succinoglycan biosynthesis protein ExoL
MEHMKTVCLLPVANDARIQRRLAALARHGVATEVLAFEREQYAGKPVAATFQSLGRIDHGHYLRRLKALIRAVPVVRAAIADAKVVYTFSLDLHLLAWMATRMLRRRPSLVYEVADIHPTLVGTGLISRAMRALERRVLSDTHLVVVTSEAFVTGFYRGVQKIARLPHLLIENKPNLESVNRTIQDRRRRSGPLTIGYFGMIRCQRSWKALQRIAERGNGRILIYIRGFAVGIPNFEQEAAASPWIEYGGPYVAPDDLPNMYVRIDLCWNAHRVDENNSLLWNRTNRFYEACAFHTPMVAQEGSQDGQVVAQEGLGLCVDLNDVETTAMRVLDVTTDDLRTWRRHMLCLPRSVYTENGEHQELADRILRLANAV